MPISKRLWPKGALPTSNNVPKALLGDDFDGAAFTDFFSAYSPLDIDKAKCWRHLLSDSHALAKGKPPDSERGQFHQRL